MDIEHHSYFDDLPAELLLLIFDYIHEWHIILYCVNHLFRSSILRLNNDKIPITNIKIIIHSISLLEWGIEHEGKAWKKDLCWKSRICDLAVEFNNLEVLEKAFEYKYDCSIYTYSKAALCGNLKLFQCSKNKHFRFKGTDEICTAAMRGGHMNILQYLINKKCNWNYETISTGIELGNFDMIQYLYDNRCRELDGKEIIVYNEYLLTKNNINTNRFYGCILKNGRFVIYDRWTKDDILIYCYDKYRNNNDEYSIYAYRHQLLNLMFKLRVSELDNTNENFKINFEDCRNDAVKLLLQLRAIETVEKTNTINLQDLIYLIPKPYLVSLLISTIGKKLGSYKELMVWDTEKLIYYYKWSKIKLKILVELILSKLKEKNLLFFYPHIDNIN